MIVEAFRPLLYPLGFIASLLFAFRMLHQWLSSEKQKQSTVTSSFWRISFTAHLLMAIHSLIQIQYPVCLIQSLNSVIAWRNLNLMRQKRKPLAFVFVLLSIVSISITTLFWLQSHFQGIKNWMQPPALPWTTTEGPSLSLSWHLLGISAITLFASRFWIQWWLAEKNKHSTLSASFWWISLVGASLSVVYFLRLNDLVNVISYASGLVPYLRNILLLKRSASNAETILQKDKIFVFAGEQSGDLLGGPLIQSLKKKNPSLTFYGVGGSCMQQQGLTSILPIDRFQVMGFSSVLVALPRILKQFYTLRKRILKDRPGAVILIDYQDFNMHLEKSLRKQGYTGTLIHYVCPSVWAWRKSRISTLSKSLDLLLTIFPFEKALFDQTKLTVRYVGHPLVKAVEEHSYDPTWKAAHGHKTLIALFPGSRFSEIKANLPLQIKTAEKLFSQFPDFHFTISVARPDLHNYIQTFLSSTSIPYTLVPAHFRYEQMKASSLALATSGTITLELALHATPTVVTYPISFLNYVLGKHVFKILLPHYCIVNIIADKEIFPECIERNPSPEEVFVKAKELLTRQETCRTLCKEIRSHLSSSSEKEDAADVILQRVNSL